MKQITEDYVSFETAKLLKEKGFKNEYCDNMLLAEDGTVINKYATFRNKDDAFWATMKFKEQIPWVTHQMAMKWLRNIHGLFIHIDVIREASCWTADIQDIKNDVAVYPVKEEFPGYEEACGAAIKYCLENLI